MSKTYTKKVHQGEIKKRENLIAKKKEEELEKERQEAAAWSDEPKPVRRVDAKQEKLVEKMEHKQKLKELYEKEMNEEE